MPLSKYTCPFHIYPPQVSISSDDVELLLIIKFKVAVESQPTLLVVANVYVPLSVYIAPFQSKLSQAVTSSDDVELLLIVKFKVAVCVQPDSLVDSKV